MTTQLSFASKPSAAPTPGVEVKIVDPATGETLGDNTQGEFCCRGHAVMLGYYKNPEATAAAIDNEGWLHTGDLAIRTPKGYYRITGRIKDMLIRGGENIYPREIEECLFTHPAIEQAAVVGVPDLKYGEEVCAWIRLRAGATLTEDEVREFCKKQLAHYKTPKYVRFVEAFSANRHRQNPKIQNPRNDDRRTPTQAARNGLDQQVVVPSLREGTAPQNDLRSQMTPFQHARQCRS